MRICLFLLREQVLRFEIKSLKKYFLLICFMVELSMVIPAFRVVNTLEKCVNAVENELKKTKKSYEIIITEDGNTDGTDKAAAKLAKKNKHVIHLHYDNKLGKGLALKKGFNKAKGKFLMYIDSDMEVNPKYIGEVVRLCYEGYDMVIASKRCPGAKVKTSLLRNVLSKGYNFLLRTFLGSKCYDPQAGLKGFKRDVLLRILPYVQDNKWFWDAEVMLIGQWMGYSLVEFPIECEYALQGSTLNPYSTVKELLKDIIRMFVNKNKIKKRIHEGQLNKV